MMTSRERVLTALDHREPDRVPIDVGSLPVSGICAGVYPAIVEALGLPPRDVRIIDVPQQLAAGRRRRAARARRRLHRHRGDRSESARRLRRRRRVRVVSRRLGRAAAPSARRLLLRPRRAPAPRADARCARRVPLARPRRPAPLRRPARAGAPPARDHGLRDRRAARLRQRHPRHLPAHPRLHGVAARPGGLPRLRRRVLRARDGDRRATHGRASSPRSASSSMSSPRSTTWACRTGR